VGFCELADCRVAALSRAYTSATDDSKPLGARKTPFIIELALVKSLLDAPINDPELASAVDE